MNRNKSYLTEGIILMVLTAGCYLAAYFYERGFASHFQIPPELIVVDIRSLLFFGAVVLGFGVIVFQILNLVVMIHNDLKETENHSGLRVFFRKHIVLVTLPLIIWLIAGYEAKDIVRLFWWNAFWMLFDLTPPILTRQTSESYDAALAGWLKFRSDSDSPDLANSLLSSRGKAYFIAGMLLFLMFVMCFSAGLGVARHQKSFGLDSSGQVLLRRYGDNLLFAKLANDKKTMLPVFQQIEVRDQKSSLTIFELGPFPETSLTKFELAPVKKELMQPHQASLLQTNRPQEMRVSSNGVSVKPGH